MDFAWVPDFAGGCGIDWQIAMELVHKNKARIDRIASPSTSDKGSTGKISSPGGVLPRLC
jgi:hypothetical protein